MWPFLFFCAPARLCLILLSLFVSHLLLQLLMRYVKMSTSSLCRGRERQLEKLSTTNVQLMPLVSCTALLASHYLHMHFCLLM